MQFNFPATSEQLELIPKSEINKNNLVEIQLKLQKPQVYVDIDLLVLSDRGSKYYSLTLRPGAVRSRLIRIPKNSEGIWFKQKREPVELAFNKIKLVKFPLPISLWIIQQRLAHFKRQMPLNKSLAWRAYNQTFSAALGIKNYQSWIRYKEKITNNLPNTILKKNIDLSVTYIVFKDSRYESNNDSILHEDISDKKFDLRQRDEKTLERLKKNILKSDQNNSGHYCFIKQGELVAKHAPKLISQYAAANKEAIFYSDEDVVLNKNRLYPEFKPEWNPEYFMSANYTGRSVIFPAWAIKDVDFSTFIPTTKSVGKVLSNALKKRAHADVIHIPKICMHRTHEKHTDRYQNLTVPHLDIPNRNECNQSVDIIIPTRDKLEILKPCVDSILKKSTYKNFQITIIDNNSQRNESLRYFSQISQESRVRVLEYKKPFNFSAINNYAAKKSKAEVLLLLNNDIEALNNDWIQAMLQHTQRIEIGCVGAKLFYPNGWIQHAGVILGIGDVAGHSHRFYPGASNGYMNRLQSCQRISAVTAACLAVRRDIWEEVGGMDEKNLTVAYNDVDFCLRVLDAGYKNIWTPDAQLIHHESVSRGSDSHGEKRRRYKAEVDFMHRRWGHILKNDPFYHPEFSKTKEDFSLA